LARKAATVSQKLRSLQRTARKHGSINPYRLPPEFQPDFTDPNILAKAAREVFDIARKDRSIKSFFEKFKLDCGNPNDWYLLLQIISNSDGLRTKEAGAPLRWTPQVRCQLLVDFYMVKDRYPTKPISTICRLMKKDKSFAQRFWFDAAVETIRRNINHARNPVQNPTLWRVVNRTMAKLLTAFETAARKKKLRWTAARREAAWTSCIDTVVVASAEFIAGVDP
jgi:hypothetical protein